MARFLLVLAIGFTFQAGVSIVSLLDLKNSLMQDRISELKHLLEAGYSTVALYNDQAVKGLMSDAEARRDFRRPHAPVLTVGSVQARTHWRA